VTETFEPSMPASVDQQQLAGEVADKARGDGIAGRLGWPAHWADQDSPGDRAGKPREASISAMTSVIPAGGNGGDSRNGTQAKAALTEIGPVAIEMRGTGDASFATALT
jgi:hypothetical protein